MEQSTTATHHPDLANPIARFSTLSVELLLAAVILFPLLLYPIGRDQGLFAYSGQVILDGGAPYRDIFDHKGPAIYYIFAAIIGAFGKSILGVRVFFYLWAIATSQLVACVAQALYHRSARLPAVMCFAMFAAQPSRAGSWVTAQAEDLLFTIYVATALVLHQQQLRPRIWKLITAGMLLGLAVAIKPTAILCALAVAGVSLGFWLRVDKLPIGRVAAWFVWSSLGFALPFVLCAIHLASQQAMGDFYESVIEFNWLYGTQREHTLVEACIVYWLFFKGAAVLGALGMLCLGRAPRHLVWTLMALLAAGLLTVFWQSKYRVIYQWTPMIGVLVIFASVGIAASRSWVAKSCTAKPWRFALSYGLLWGGAVAMAPNLHSLTGTWRDTAQVVAGDMSLSEFQADFHVGSDNWRGIQPVVHYVKTHTEPDDKVLVWGFDVLINFAADRRSPTRFAMNRPLGFSPRVSEYREEFLKQIQLSPPAYILVANETCFFSFAKPSRDLLNDFVGFSHFLKSHYQRETTIGRFDIFRRTEPFTLTALKKDT